jgi:ABC-type sulfate transport system substrate-binding protein
MKRLPLLNLAAVAGVVIAVTLIGVKNVEGNTSNEILNVSYDPTRPVRRARWWRATSRPMSSR